MNSGIDITFDKLEKSPWFGLATQNDRLNQSIVSLYDRALNEKEAADSPMMFGDYGENRKKEIRQAFIQFFNENICNASLIKGLTYEI